MPSDVDESYIPLCSQRFDDSSHHSFESIGECVEGNKPNDTGNDLQHFFICCKYTYYLLFEEINARASASQDQHR
jgi:hypothetical protein